MKISAVIVAAGLSSRMGSFKPLLPIGNKSALQREVDTFLACGVSPVVVVCGHRADEVRSVLAPYREDVIAVFNPDYREDMFLSVKLGVASLPKDTEGFFFLPADCPAVSADSLLKLMEGFRLAQETICIPKYKGRRGHPPLLSGGLRRDIAEYQGGGGLKKFMSQYPVLEISVEDPEINRDMDTPEEYENLISSLN